jgi:hypothetical protein
MSSSFKQKKLKTLATRKKTRKRNLENGLTHEDASGRLFQPPSRRDPRWKKPDAAAVVDSIVRAAKKRRIMPSDEEDDDDEIDEPEMVDPIESEDEAAAEEALEEEEEQMHEEEEEDVPKPPLKLCTSLEDCVAAATKKHAAIRRKDTRQKAKVLILCDAHSIVKALKKTLPIKEIIPRSTSKRGVRSSGDKKVDTSYKNIAPLKTPMEKFKDANRDVLKDFQVGKIATLVAEDLSYYPFSHLAFRHVIFVARAAASAVNLDRLLLDDVELHTIVLNENGKSVSPNDRARLASKFMLLE